MLGGRAICIPTIKVTNYNSIRLRIKNFTATNSLNTFQLPSCLYGEWESQPQVVKDYVQMCTCKTLIVNIWTFTTPRIVTINGGYHDDHPDHYRNHGTIMSIIIIIHLLGPKVLSEDLSPIKTIPIPSIHPIHKAS